MAWHLRPIQDQNIYKPYECPEYRDDTLFTLKLHFNGELSESPKTYSGGSWVYVDFCDSDVMSLIEINSMLSECEARGGCYKLWYKLPGTTMDNGLFELENDDELMTLCELITNRNRPMTNRYVEIFESKIGVPLLVIPPGQEEIQMENPFPDSTQQEIDQEQDLRDLDGRDKSFSDQEEDYVLNGSDSDDESWHSDASNKDDTDDELVFEKNVEKTVFEEHEIPQEPEMDEKLTSVKLT